MKKPKQFRPKKNTSTKKFGAQRKKRSSLYDSNWEKYRRYFLKVNPKCYCCGQRSTVVDHEKTHKGDIDIFWDTNNFIPMCKLCHDTITASFDRFEPQKYPEKMMWIHQKRLSLGLESVVRAVPLSAVKSLKSPYVRKD